MVVKIGRGHNWNYKTDRWNETKIGPGTWKFTYYQTKHRAGRRAPKGSGFPEGGNLVWLIRAKQYAKKTGPNTYKLIMRGIKKQGAWRPKGGKWKVTRNRL